MTADRDLAPVSPVSFAVDVRRLPTRGFPVRFEADETARAALAESHGLLAVDAFRVDLLVERWGRDGAKVTGKVFADIAQACVVTLEPVPARIETEVEAVFVPEGSRLAAPTSGEIHVDPHGPDAPETFSGDTIDAGALAEEFFELAIDPYPRSPGAGMAGSEEGDRKQNPFAALSKLQKR